MARFKNPAEWNNFLNSSSNLSDEILEIVSPIGENSETMDHISISDEDSEGEELLEMDNEPTQIVMREHRGEGVQNYIPSFGGNSY